MSRPVNAADAQHVWDTLSKAFGSRVLRKDKRLLMKIAAPIVARRTTLTKDQFLTDYVTTFRRKIFVPPALLEHPDPAMSVLLAVHEHQHVAQWKKQRLRFLLRYARNPLARGKYELEATRAQNLFASAAGWPEGWQISYEVMIEHMRGAYGLGDDADKLYEHLPELEQESTPSAYRAVMHIAEAFRDERIIG